LTNDLNTVQWVMTIVVSSDSADWSWCCTWRAFGGAYRFFRGVRTRCDPLDLPVIIPESVQSCLKTVYRLSFNYNIW